MATMKQTILTKTLSILVAFAVSFTCIPVLSGQGSAHAAAIKGLSASARGSQTVVLSWSKLSKKQKSGQKGITVFRDGHAIANISKTATSFTDTGLAAGTYHTYQVKTYKVKTKKTKMWYNKATGRYQKKKPAKKYRGKRKTFKTTTYKYKKVTDAFTVRTAANSKSNTGDKGNSNTGGNTGSTGTTQNTNTTVTDYKGESRTITNISTSGGVMYYTAVDSKGISGVYSNLAEIDFKKDGDFVIPGGTVMWQKNGVTFEKNTLTNAGARYGRVAMYNGDPSKLHFTYTNPIRSIFTYSHDEVPQQVTKDFIMQGDLRLAGKAGVAQIGNNLRGATQVEFEFPDDDTNVFTAGVCSGCGLTKGTVEVTISYDGIGNIGKWTFNINPDGVKVDSGRGADIYLCPLRKQYWDIAMKAIPGIKTGNYDADMKTVEQYVKTNLTYSEATCITGMAILETYSICAYGIEGFAGRGGNPQNREHYAFHPLGLEGTPSTYYATQGERKN